MKPKIYLRDARQTWLESATDDKGTLSISRIAEHADVLPATLLLGPENPSAYDGITIIEVKEMYGSTAGDTMELAVLVHGIAKPAAHPEERESKRGRTGERRARDYEFRKWEPLSGAESFDMRSWVAGISVPTDSISQVMKEFDGFPLKYFVRREETMLFECVEEIMGVDRYPKLAILGSPGVGKSCFLVFLAFYLARCRSQSVLLVRRLSGDSRYAVVFLSQDGWSGWRFDNLNDIPDIRRDFISKYPRSTLWYFVDGFPPKEVHGEHFASLGTYNVLATSSQYDLKSADPTTLVVLPAWRLEDLIKFAQMNRMFKGETPLEVKAAEVYVYSGGSLREFMRDRTSLINRITFALANVSGGAQLLLSNYGTVPPNQLDRIRRLYVMDFNDRSHYFVIDKWKVLVDSSYAQMKLLDICTVRDYKNLLDTTAVCCGSVYGGAFEMYLHKRASSNEGFRVRAREYLKEDYSTYLKISPGRAVRSGADREQSLKNLDLWSADPGATYWHPDFATFPDIDSIAKCSKLSEDGEEREQVLVYFQYTVGATHSVNGARLGQVHEKCKTNILGKIYIALLPSRDAATKFSLKGTASPEIDAYVGYLE